MARIAAHVEVKRGPQGLRLEVDGEPFPWHTAGIDVGRVGNAEAPSVTVTIPAELVTVVDQLKLAGKT